MKKPNKFKAALIAWIGIYPTINVLIILLEDHMHGMPLLVRTFILTILMVPIAIFFVIPFLSKVFKKWLEK